mmetsp:Transcript_21763/g.39012  ORF Transcript_21763/g.39012 Transcript_21763/m.39012 type:complete len:233 (+) Transcript_21763:526-1224(+)
MFRTVLPPRPITTLPSSQPISISLVTALDTSLIDSSTASLAFAADSFDPRIFTTCVFLSTAMLTSCSFSISRMRSALLAVSNLMPFVDTFSRVSTQAILSSTAWISVLAFSFPASVPLTSRTETPWRRASWTFAPDDEQRPSMRSGLKILACSAVSFTASGGLLASEMHSWRTAFHLATPALSPRRRTPVALRTTVKPEVSRISPNFDVCLGLLSSLPLPLPLPFLGGAAAS